MPKMSFKNIIEFSKKIFIQIKLEYIALLLFTVLLLFFYNQRYFSYILLVFAAIIGVLFFIVFNKFLARDEQLSLFNISDDKLRRIQLISSALFFLFYGLSALTLLDGFYTKTIWYYVFISLCFGVLAFEILLVKTKTQGNLIFFKSLLLILNITLSNQILFPYGIGLPDSNYHLNRLVIPIVNYGTVSAGSGTYVSFPGHHILIAINSIILHTDPRLTYLYLGSLIMPVIGLLFVYLIGQKFENQKFGLFAALIYASSDYLTNWSSHPSQMAFIYPLALMILAIILYRYKDRDWRYSIFFPILVISMIFSHHFSAMIVLLILMAFAIVEITYSFKDSKYLFIFPRLVILYLVILFTQWMYHSRLIGGLVNIIVSYTESISQDIATSGVAPTNYDTLPIYTIFVNEIGSGILIFVSVIGFLYFFSNRTFFRDIVMTSTIIFTILMGIGVVYSEPYLLPHRIYAFLQEFSLVFLASSTIMRLQVHTKKLKLISCFFIVGLFVFLSFFSLSSTIAGFETSQFIGDQGYQKLYDTPFEKYSREWINAYTPFNSNITNRAPIKEGYNSKSYLVDGDNITMDNFIRFSKFDMITGFSYGVRVGTSHIGYHKYIKLDENSVGPLNLYNNYYNNGMIDIYYKGFY